MNAASLLFFRYFITVDGPLHVLHASLLEAPWPAAEHEAQGITYNRAGIGGSLGGRILMVLLHFFSPAEAHDLFAAMVSCCVVVAVVAFLRTQGARIGPAVLWLAPFTFNLLLVMGLFHFLLGTAIAFGSVAWWKWRAHAPLGRWTGLLAGVLLAWCTHRGAPALLVLLVLPAFLHERYAQRPNAAMASRPSRTWWLVGIGALLILGLVMFSLRINLVTTHWPGKLPGIDELFFHRPLFLVDHARERWMVLTIGGLFVAATAAAAMARYRMGRQFYWHDPLLLLAVTFILVAWVSGMIGARELLIAERSEWLASLLSVCWLTAMAGCTSGTPRWVMAISAVCALPLHTLRVVRMEQLLATFARTHTDALEAVSVLSPNSVVFPVMADPHPMLQNLPAYVAIAHNGIVLPRHQRINLLMSEPDPFLGYTYVDNAWLLRSWRLGLPERIDHVLFLGRGIGPAARKHPWPTLLKDRFKLSSDNGEARVYTAVRDGTPSMKATMP